MIPTLTRQFFFVGRNNVQTSLCPWASFASEIRRQLAAQELIRSVTLSRAMRQVSVWVAGVPTTASSGLHAHTLKSIRKHGPYVLLWPSVILMPQCPPEPSSFRLHPDTGSASCDLLLPRHIQEAASWPPPHTSNFVPLQVPLSTVPSKESRVLLCLVCRNFQSPQSLTPTFSTTVCKGAWWSCSRMSETSEEPLLENGSSLGSNRTQ